MLCFLIAARSGGLLALLVRSFGRVDHDQNVAVARCQLLRLRRGIHAAAILAGLGSFGSAGGARLASWGFLSLSSLSFCVTVVALEGEFFDVNNLSLQVNNFKIRGAVRGITTTDMKFDFFCQLHKNRFDGETSQTNVVFICSLMWRSIAVRSEYSYVKLTKLILKHEAWNHSSQSSQAIMSNVSGCLQKQKSSVGLSGSSGIPSRYIMPVSASGAAPKAVVGMTTGA